jgi:hypothetical protein
MRESIEVGHQVFLADGGEEVGAVRQVQPHGKPVIVVWVENAGDFSIPLEAVKAVHSQKVILEAEKLDEQLLAAIGKSHDAEKPGL